MASKAELACVYSALILCDDDVAVTAEKMATILKAANVTIEPYWPGLFAKCLEGLNIKDMISHVGVGGGGGAPAAAAPAAAAGGGGAPAGGAAPAAAAEAKKEEAKDESESDEDMGFGLFD